MFIHSVGKHILKTCCVPNWMLGVPLPGSSWTGILPALQKPTFQWERKPQDHKELQKLLGSEIE